MKRLVCLVAASSVAAAACGSSSSDPKPLFEPKPECQGQSIVPLGGHQQMVISYLEIGKRDDGFDLDGDGAPDNKLSGVGNLAQSAIKDAFDDFSIVLPLEFFDFDPPGVDECVKFAVYLGQYALDIDADDDATADDRGDCNDHDAAINKDAAEVPDNYKDDDCDGKADEYLVTEQTDGGTLEMWVDSDNEDDMDGDGVTIKDGDCDDTNDAVKPGADEVCGDGFDNDCDGNADYQLDGDGNPVCTPYDDSAAPDTVMLDPLSFVDGDMSKGPVIAFTSGTAVQDAGVLHVTAGPSIFSVNIPVTDDLNLDLRITGATIEADMMQMAAGYGVVNGRLGGVIDANTADKVTGLELEDIGLTEDQTLLDATFANILGTLIGLPKLPMGEFFEGCMSPDIDVDRDGLEHFCDSDVLDDLKHVDVCIDGDGTVYCESTVTNELALAECDVMVTGPCTEQVDDDGDLRFVDGISIEINFETVPVLLPTP